MTEREHCAELAEVIVRALHARRGDYHHDHCHFVSDLIERERAAARRDGLRAGVELARENAEISETDGWVRTAPFIEWRSVERKLELAIRALGDAEEKP
jgi:hypothetical protein